MSGHSKWSTIKRQKGAADAKRGMTFTKLANVITIAAKLGGSGDPDSNPRLRLALDQARQANMPKDNVQRAIDRGLGKLPGQTIEEVVYEGFGPGKVAYLVEAMTDNKLRTLQEMKNLFDRSGGSLGGSGSVAYMFDKKGEIKIKGRGENKDDQMLELIDAGADDVEDFEEDGVQKYLVYTEPAILSDIANNLRNGGFTVESQEIVFKPNLTVEIGDREQAGKVLDFTEKLEDHDDIQKVHTNFDIPEQLMS
jgi:YebC/PmpR family DNA-binding regulatory protein